MKRLASLLGLAIVAGCSSNGDMSKADEASFKKSVDAGNQKLDPDTLPPDVRDRVKGIMEAQKHMGSGPPKPNK